MPRAVHQADSWLRPAGALVHANGEPLSTRMTAGKPQLWIGVVNNRDATVAKVQAALARRGMTHAVRLFELLFVPRGISGKVNRDQLKAALLTSKPGAT